MGGMFIHWRSFIVGVDIGMGRVKHFRDPNIKAFSMEELAMSWNAGVDFSIFKYSDFVLTLLWTSFHLWNSYHATTSSSSSAKSRAACTKIWGRQCILLGCTIVRAVTKICFNEIAIYDWCVDRNITVLMGQMKILLFVCSGLNIKLNICVTERWANFPRFVAISLTHWLYWVYLIAVAIKIM